MSDCIQIEPVIGWPAYCDEIMSLLSLTQLEVSNLKVEVADLTDTLDALNAENERLRKALKGCKTHIAGFHLTDPDQASAVLSEINSELQRIHRAVCAALEAP